MAAQHALQRQSKAADLQAMDNLPSNMQAKVHKAGLLILKKRRPPSTSYTTLSMGVAAIVLLSVVMMLQAAGIWQQVGRTPRRERVAVCIAGNARTFRYPFMHTTILSNIIKPLRREYDTDVFFILRMDDAGARNRSLRSFPDAEATLNAVHQFAPTKFTWITSTNEFNHSRFIARTDSAYEAMSRPQTCGPSRESAVRLPHALFRAKQCLEQIEEHEVATGSRFDWVYRLRPDVLVFDRVLLPRDLRKDILYCNQGRTSVTNDIGKWWLNTRGGVKAGFGAIADQMSMCSRKVAAIALRAFDAVDDCELYNAVGQHIPEGIYRFWLLKKRVRYEAVPFDWVTVREHVGPECYRLYFQIGQHSNWTRSMARCYRFARLVQHYFPRMDNVSHLLQQLPSLERPENDVNAI